MYRRIWQTKTRESQNWKRSWRARTTRTKCVILCFHLSAPSSAPDTNSVFTILAIDLLDSSRSTAQKQDSRKMGWNFRSLWWQNVYILMSRSEFLGSTAESGHHYCHCDYHHHCSHVRLITTHPCQVSATVFFFQISQMLMRGSCEHGCATFMWKFNFLELTENEEAAVATRRGDTETERPAGENRRGSATERGCPAGTSVLHRFTAVPRRRNEK